MSGRITHGVAGLVGRTAEIHALVSELDEAAQGQARMILIRGSAGSGKTTMLDVLEGRARAAGAVVLRGACLAADARRSWHAAEGLLGGSRAERPAVPRSQRLLRRVIEAAAPGPVVIMLDDAQWCDDESLTWLEFLLNRRHRLPLLVVLAQHRGAGGRGCSTIDLAPLRDEAAGELARRWLGVEPDAPFAGVCNRVCRGNPSLLVRLFEQLSMGSDRGEERVRELGAELFARRVLVVLDRQPAYIRKVVEAVAVLGGADAELVGMLGAVPEPLVTAATGILRDEEVIEAGLVDLDDDQVRSRVLSTMPAGELERSRRLAARLLNDAGRPVEEICAQLVRLSGLPEPWMLDVLRSAAHAAERDGSVATAVRHLRRLVAADPAGLDVRADLARLVGLDDPVGAYEMLHAWIEGDDDQRGRARLAVQLAGIAPSAGKEVEAISTLGGILTDLGDDHELRTSVRSALSLLGERHRSTRMLSKHVTTMELPESLAVRSMVAALSGTSARACVALARRALSGADVTWAAGPAAYVLSLADEVGEAVQAVDRMIMYATEHGDDRGRTMALSTRSLILGEAGDLGQALTDATRAVGLADERSWPRGGMAARTALVVALAQRGDIGRADSNLAELSAFDMEKSLLDYSRVLMTRSQLAAWRGDPEDALAALTACGALLAETGARNPRFVPWWLDAACLLADLDRRNEASEFVEQGEQLAAVWGTTSARGLALLARGAITEGSAGVEVLAESVKTLAGTSARWYLVRAEILLGEALLRADDREGAREHFRQAVRVSVRCGFREPAAKARDRLVAAGGRMFPSADLLTAAERRVAELAASGATNRELAQALSIAVRTVEIHLTSIFRKLDVSGRADLEWVLDALRETGPDQAGTG
ncbi:BREX system ATP-binding domain-containing protein [Nonomuraea sp. NPDC001699]